jgi:thermitase
MKSRSFLGVGGVLVVLLLSCSLAFAVMGLPAPARTYLPGEVIVGFHPKTHPTHIHAAVSSIGGTIKGHLDLQKASIARVKLPSTDPSAVDAAINNLKSNPAFANVIMFVEPNMIRQAMQVRGSSGDVSALSQSADPLLAIQWGYYDIDANRIKAPTTTAGVTVAVIDTGVDYTNPDLAGKVIKGYDFVNLDNDPMDDFGHGTHVAGIIAAKANNNYGIVGVSWNSKILAIKALDFTGSGNSYDISLAIIAAAKNSSVKVINMSLGGSYSQAEDLAVDYAVVTKGKLLVAAAGNNGNNTPIYPAGLSVYSYYYPGGYTNMVLAVTAHDSTDCKASFSNYGSYVSISAPGVNIISDVPVWGTLGSLDGFAEMSGTSMAAPHVAGAAALAWQQYPTYTNSTIGSMIVTLNSSPRVTLTRDNVCWPNDGTLFQKLDVMHLLDSPYYDFCNSNEGYIYGWAFDAETGLPLAGAKVTANQGKTIDTEYVPYYGDFNALGGSAPVYSGYGLFGVLGPIGNDTLTIQKSGYLAFTPKDQNGLPVPISVTNCNWSDAGTISVPPAQPLYWLAITWDYGYTSTFFDL